MEVFVFILPVYIETFIVIIIENIVVDKINKSHSLNFLGRTEFQVELSVVRASLPYVPQNNLQYDHLHYTTVCTTTGPNSF